MAKCIAFVNFLIMLLVLSNAQQTASDKLNQLNMPNKETNYRSTKGQHDYINLGNGTNTDNSTLAVLDTVTKETDILTTKRIQSIVYNQTTDKMTSIATSTESFYHDTDNDDEIEMNIQSENGQTDTGDSTFEEITHPSDTDDINSSNTINFSSPLGSNIYKVPNKRSNKTESAMYGNGDGVNKYKMQIETILLKQFHNMFDHYSWHLNNKTDMVSQQCTTDMEKYLHDLHKGSPWALKAYDASGHYRGTFLFGNKYWLGSKTFCEQINEEPSIMSNQIDVQYYLIEFSITMPSTTKLVDSIQLGQCLPTACTTMDISKIIESDPTLVRLKVHSNNLNLIKLQRIREIPGSYQLLNDKRFILLISIVAVTLILTIIATVYEYRLNKNSLLVTKHTNKVYTSVHELYNAAERKMDTNIMNGMIQNSDSNVLTNNNYDGNKNSERTEFWKNSLLCFGLIQNVKTIMSLKIQCKNSISCIHGLRVFSMLWIICVHSALTFFTIMENKYLRNMYERSFGYQIINGATFAVDCFFFISGLLVTLSYYRIFATERKTSSSDLMKTLIAIIYRYIRLTPVYFLVILLQEINMKIGTNSSVLTIPVLDDQTCPKYWWRNLLYIQNMFSPNEVCMTWSWYLAVDMWLYIIAIVLLTTARRFFKLTVTIMGILILASLGISSYIVYKFNYNFNISMPLESMGLLYDKPWTRIGPYFIATELIPIPNINSYVSCSISVFPIVGMMTGYVIYRTKTIPKITNTTKCLLWIISLVITTLFVFITIQSNMNAPLTILYIWGGHLLWSIAMVWITLAAHWNYSTIVNKLLTYRALLPLSRLTFCTYLIHLPLQFRMALNLENAIHIQPTFTFVTFLGTACLSYGVGFIITILFEAPTVRILKLIFKK